MFDSKASHRLSDSLDLLIDFATLGEYGLEPTGPPTRALTPCAGDRRRPTAIQTSTPPRAPKRRQRGPQRPTRSKTATKAATASSDLWAQMNTHPSRERNPSLRTGTNPRAKIHPLPRLGTECGAKPGRPSSKR